MLTGRAKAYSSSCPQAVNHRSTNRVRRRVTSFQPKRVTNYATPPTPVPWRHLVNDIPCVAAQNRKKPIKPNTSAFKVIEFGANRKPVYDFLLVINNNLGTVIDIQRLIGQKSQILPTPFSFSALVRGNPLRIYGKGLRLLKL